MIIIYQCITDGGGQHLASIKNFRYRVLCQDVWTTLTPTAVATIV